MKKKTYWGENTKRRNPHENRDQHKKPEPAQKMEPIFYAVYTKEKSFLVDCGKIL